VTGLSAEVIFITLNGIEYRVDLNDGQGVVITNTLPAASNCRQ
jgi:hypothetical protein